MELSFWQIMAIFIPGFLISMMILTFRISYLYAKGCRSEFWGLYGYTSAQSLNYHQTKNLPGKLFISIFWLITYPVWVAIVVSLFLWHIFDKYVLENMSSLGFIMGTPKSSLTEPHPIEKKCDDVAPSTNNDSPAANENNL